MGAKRIENPRWLVALERTLIAAGFVLLAAWTVALGHKTAGQRAAVAEFEEMLLAMEGATLYASRPGPVGPRLDEPATPDVSLWDKKRIAMWEETLSTQTEAPMAILKIPSIGLKVAVLNGTDDFTLNRAVGRIPGTGWPWSQGNLGIAGHRDGFFRGLKDVTPGELIELQTPGGPRRYEIDEILIVDPEDAEVLAPTTRSSITLVTCYPFYFVGSAPKRYIVRAVALDEGGGNGG